MTNTRRGVVTGIGLVSSLGIATEAHCAALVAGPSGTDTITRFDTSELATRIARELRRPDPPHFIANGPNAATCTACSASAHAIGDAFEVIRRDAADVMIAGGSEAAITPMSVGGFGAVRALSTRNDQPARASRPFDKDRDGFVIGEGAGVIILEELEFARRRGARIYA